MKSFRLETKSGEGKALLDLLPVRKYYFSKTPKYYFSPEMKRKQQSNAFCGAEMMRDELERLYHQPSPNPIKTINSETYSFTYRTIAIDSGVKENLIKLHRNDFVQQK